MGSGKGGGGVNMMASMLTNAGYDLSWLNGGGSGQPSAQDPNQTSPTGPASGGGEGAETNNTPAGPYGPNNVNQPVTHPYYMKEAVKALAYDKASLPGISFDEQNYQRTKAIGAVGEAQRTKRAQEESRSLLGTSESDDGLGDTGGYGSPGSAGDVGGGGYGGDLW